MANTGLVVDTSAAVAVLIDEPGADWLLNRLAESQRSVMPAATYLELAMVIESRYGQAATGLAARFVRDAEVEIVDVSAEAAERSEERRGGKEGSGGGAGGRP